MIRLYTNFNTKLGHLFWNGGSSTVVHLNRREQRCWSCTINQVRAYNYKLAVAHEKASKKERIICLSSFSGRLPLGDAASCWCCSSFPASCFCCSRARHRHQRRPRRWSPTCQDSMALSPSTSKPGKPVVGSILKWARASHGRNCMSCIADTWAWRRRLGRSSSTTWSSRRGAPAQTPSSCGSPAGPAARASASGGARIRV